MLVLHLGAELGGLEQPLTVPIQRRIIDVSGNGRAGSDRGQQPLVQELHVTG
jgi:hypothetical protein